MEGADLNSETTRAKEINRLNTYEIGKDHIWYLHYNAFHKDLLSAFKEYSSGQLLDIGCGNKPYQDFLKDYSLEYMGCDIVQSSKKCVDIICPASKIPLPDDSFDTIISTQTIEHVEDHQGLVNEAIRLLRPNGYFILSGPMYWPLHEEPYDFFRFTKYGFTYILEKAGFRVVSIRSNGGKWSVAGQAFLHALYPHINNVKGIKGKIARGLIKVLGGVSTINKLFSYLDSKATDHVNTMNYVIVARKYPAE